MPSRRRSEPLLIHGLARGHCVILLHALAKGVGSPDHHGETSIYRIGAAGFSTNAHPLTVLRWEDEGKTWRRRPPLCVDPPPLPPMSPAERADLKARAAALGKSAKP